VRRIGSLLLFVGLAAPASAGVERYDGILKLKPEAEQLAVGLGIESIAVGDATETLAGVEELQIVGGPGEQTDIDLDGGAGCPGVPITIEQFRGGGFTDADDGCAETIACKAEYHGRVYADAGDDVDPQCPNLAVGNERVRGLSLYPPPGGGGGSTIEQPRVDLRLGHVVSRAKLVNVRGIARLRLQRKTARGFVTIRSRRHRGSGWVALGGEVAYGGTYRLVVLLARGERLATNPEVWA
jgi:hypothetical protein